MSLFTGSGVAIITPFNSDGTINYPKLKELIEFQIKNETDAIIICGTTGEASTLTDADQIECIRFTVECVAGRVPVIAGAGSNETPHAAYLAKACEEVGADGVLIVTPYYNKTTQKGLIAHYKYIAERINIPIIVYNVPGRTGMTIAPSTYYELSKIKNIEGIKEASGNIGNITKTSGLCGDSMTIYSGDDNLIVPILSVGGKGVISVLANVAPKQTHDMVMKYLEGDVKAAAKLQIEAMGLIDALFMETSPIPVKAAMNLMGMDVGICKLPLVEMEDANVEHLKKEMKSYGLI